MKKDIADKWVTALRSGKYKQTQGQLKSEDRYCCLGVLCEISLQGTWKGRTYFTGHSTDNDSTVGLTVRDWSGLKESCGHLGNTEIHSLAGMNDEGSTFNEIADIIEKKWEQL